MSTITIDGQAGPREPFLQLNHIDGPLLITSDGGLHWLTWSERISLFFGLTDIQKLDKAWVGRTHIF